MISLFLIFHILYIFSVSAADPKTGITSDNTSLVFADPQAQIRLDPQASLKVKGQSVLQILPIANAAPPAAPNVQLENGAVLLVQQAGHVTLANDLILDERAAIGVDASRWQIKGPVRMGNDSWLQMFDNSLFRVNEGGRVTVGSGAHMEMYRGAYVKVSKRSQRSGVHENTTSHVTFGDRMTFELFDRSALKVARGGLATRNDAKLFLSGQSQLTVNGHLNVSDHGRIKLGVQALFQLGVIDDDQWREEGSYDPLQAPTLVFAKASLELTIQDRIAFKVDPGAHCMLTKSAEIKENVAVTAGSFDRSYVTCFASIVDLKAALGPA